MTGGMRRCLVAVAAALLAAGLLYTWFWFDRADDFAARIDAWAGRASGLGYEVRHAGVAVGGFPFRFRARVERPEVIVPQPHGALAWRGPRLELIYVAWRPRDLTLRLPPESEIVRTDDRRTRVFELSAERAVATIALGPAGRHRFEAAGIQLRPVGDTGAFSVGKLVFEAAALPADAAAAGGPPLALDLDLVALRLPAGAETALGRDIARLSARTRLVGPLPVAPPPAALAAWRDGGGTLEIEKLWLHWGPLSLAADGTLALDRAMQPIAALTAKVSGYAKTLEALVAAGAMRPTDAATARIVLDLLSRRPEGGGPAVVRVPLTAQDGRLYAGPVNLFRIPPIPWQ